MMATFPEVGTNEVGGLVRVPVSCFVIACNEADRIARTLTAVKDLVEEIVVVDSGSTDETVNVAIAHGARDLDAASAAILLQQYFDAMGAAAAIGGAPQTN